MAESERRLVAILFTDIAGYTAMVGSSESRGIEARDELSALMRGFFADAGPMAKR